MSHCVTQGSMWNQTLQVVYIADDEGVSNFDFNLHKPCVSVRRSRIHLNVSILHRFLVKCNNDRKCLLHLKISSNNFSYNVQMFFFCIVNIFCISLNIGGNEHQVMHSLSLENNKGLTLLYAKSIEKNIGILNVSLYFSEWNERLLSR